MTITNRSGPDASVEPVERHRTLGTQELEDRGNRQVHTTALASGHVHQIGTCRSVTQR